MTSDNSISKRKILLISVGILVVVLAAVLIVWLSTGGTDVSDPTLTDPSANQEDTGQTTGPPGTDETEPDQTEPDETGTTGPDETKPTEPGQSGETEPTESATTPTVVDPPSDEDILCSEVYSYDGEFIEDGKGEIVHGVAAILVTNSSDQFLDLANVNYDIEGEKATFVVTGLPAGESCWVMETTRMTVSDDSDCSYLGCTTSYRGDVVATTDKITIQTSTGAISATNNTDETLENVFVYYKVLYEDGNYFGGITYMVSFDTLEPGQTVDKVAGHYEEGSTRIVRVGWQESRTDEAS